jgi:mono/diheme cytochrome c family protein
LTRRVIAVLGLMLAICLNTSQAREPAAQDLVNRLNCHACHALGGQGGKRGPSWDGVGQRLTPEAIKKQIVSPKGGCMPNFAHLRAEELDAVVNYLSGMK